MPRRMRLTYASPLARHQALVWLADDAPAPARMDVGAALRQELLVSCFRSDLVPLCQGRFYPSRLIQGQVLPRTVFRVIALDDAHFTADMSHPLHGHEFALHAEQADAPAPGMGTVPQLLAWAGMETERDAATDFSVPMAYARDDARDDAEFYAQPRRVIHVDSVCASRIKACYRALLPEGARVLDLMAGWRSHLPDGGGEVTGLGMNVEELRENPQLASHRVQDLNREPGLPFADAGFDAVVCSVSIEYLIEPQKVMAEVRRVLRPGGVFAVTCSQRFFPPKVIRLWTQLHPMERMAWVASLLRRAGFSDLHTHVERGLMRPADDRYADRLPESDPLFAVWGRA